MAWPRMHLLLHTAPIQSCICHAVTNRASTNTLSNCATTSGANTGVHVLRGFDTVSDLAIDGDTAAFAYGYMEAMRGFSLAHVGAGLSKQVPTGHPDIHRRFSLAATDGSLAYFGTEFLSDRNVTLFAVLTRTNCNQHCMHCRVFFPIMRCSPCACTMVVCFRDHVGRVASWWVNGLAMRTRTHTRTHAHTHTHTFPQQEG